MVLIICTKNDLNLTNRYCDMVPDRQKVRTDGQNGRMDGRHQNYIPLTWNVKHFFFYKIFEHSNYL